MRLDRALTATLLGCALLGAPALAKTKTTSTAATTSASTGSPSTGNAVFPKAIDAKYAKLKPGSGRMKTCADQYRANKAANANGGMKWIEKGGGYYSACVKHLKGG